MHVLCFMKDQTSPTITAVEARDLTLANRLCTGLASMATSASVPMDLWDRFSKDVLKAAAILAAAPQPETAEEGDLVGTAEREVGRYIYMRIEAFMDAEFETPEGRELSYLAQIVADVEEYGVDLMEPNDLQPMKEWFAAPTQQAVVSEGVVEALIKARKIIADIDEYQSKPSPEWGSECACCMGELLDEDREAIAEIDAVLSALTGDQP